MVFRKSRRIAQDAHAAAVRIYSEDLTESERLAIKARCEEDPVFKARFVEAHHLFGALDDWRDELREDSLYRATPRRHGTVARRMVRNVVAPGVAAAGLVGFATWFVAPQYFEDAGTVIRHSTQVGEQRTLTLDDGSTVTLNTRSQILVGMTDNVRRIVMDRGEAHFEVAPDPLRPFTVEVGGQSITAHGTEFNLRRNDDGFALALIDGRLALHRQGREPPADPPWLDLRQHPVDNGSLARDEFGLVAGAVVDFNAHDQTFAAHHDSNVARRQQWRQGRLTFIDEPMARVVAELSRYSEKPIRIHDPKVGDIRVFATLRLDSIDEALTTLENAVPIRVVPTLTGIAVLAAETESNALH
ncbi:MAG: FecR domain-containing protein [Gammaproteobacteria bacterium]|nr:FecR domain-containing protein [Gammaproteobacteria bacterium]